MSVPYIHLHPKDNVLVALDDLKAGISISFEGREFKLRQHIPVKHKFAIAELKTGDAVVMYGVVVGKAMQHIPPAGLINIHNVENAVEAYSAGIKNYNWTAPDVE
jgi:altronate hydrolase